MLRELRKFNIDEFAIKYVAGRDIIIGDYLVDETPFKGIELIDNITDSDSSRLLDITPDRIVGHCREVTYDEYVLVYRYSLRKLFSKL